MSYLIHMQYSRANHWLYKDGHKSCAVMKPRHTDHPLVVGCCLGHEPHPLNDIRLSPTKSTFFPMMVSAILSSSYYTAVNPNIFIYLFFCSLWFYSASVWAGTWFHLINTVLYRLFSSMSPVLDCSTYVQDIFSSFWYQGRRWWHMNHLYICQWLHHTFDKYAALQLIPNHWGIPNGFFLL